MNQHISAIWLFIGLIVGVAIIMALQPQNAIAQTSVSASPHASLKAESEVLSPSFCAPM